MVKTGMFRKEQRKPSPPKSGAFKKRDNPPNTLVSLRIWECVRGRSPKISIAEAIRKSCLSSIISRQFQCLREGRCLGAWRRRVRKFSVPWKRGQLSRIPAKTGQLMAGWGLLGSFERRVVPRKGRWTSSFDRCSCSFQQQGDACQTPSYLLLHR
jgi:polyferredoxin